MIEESKDVEVVSGQPDKSIEDKEKENETGYDRNSGSGKYGKHETGKSNPGYRSVQ